MRSTSSAQTIQERSVVISNVNRRGKYDDYIEALRDRQKEFDDGVGSLLSGLVDSRDGCGLESVPASRA